MGSSQEQRFRVRLSDGETSVEGIEGLLELARTAVLSPTTHVCREGKEEWVMAERIPALRLHFSTTSWGGLEGFEIDSESEQDEPTDVEDLPMEALEPVLEPLAPSSDPASVEDLPLEALTPMGAPQMVIHSDNRSKRRRREEEARSAKLSEPLPEPSASTSGELIEFPVGALPDAQEESHPILDALNRLESRRSPDAPRAQVRWRGLVLLAMIMFGGVGLMSWHLETEATVTRPPIPDDVSTQAQAAQSQGEEPGLAELEAELRTALKRRPGLHEVSRGPLVEKNEQDAKVEEAIKKDLQFQMKVLPGTVVFADVLSFKNGADRMPHELQLEVTLVSDASRLRRDLGSVGLVVGRFITDYNIGLVKSQGLANHFLVKLRMGNSGSMKVVQMDWRETRKFYKQSLTLKDFLDTGVVH
jgi:hypothetical protein